MLRQVAFRAPSLYLWWARWQTEDNYDESDWGHSERTHEWASEMDTIRAFAGKFEAERYEFVGADSLFWLEI